MAMVGVDSGSLYRRTHSLGRLAFCRRPLGAVLHSSNEPGELSQWLCHDDSTINIVLDIIIIIIVVISNFNNIHSRAASQRQLIFLLFKYCVISAHRITTNSQMAINAYDEQRKLSRAPTPSSRSNKCIGPEITRPLQRWCGCKPCWCRRLLANWRRWDCVVMLANWPNDICFSE